MKLIQLIKRLREVNDKKVYCSLEDSYEDLYILDGYDSYRGDYEITSYEPTKNINRGMTAHQFANSLENAIGSLIIGYKGGRFHVDEDLPVAIAEYGHTGEYIAEVIEESDRIFLKTMIYDEYYSHNFNEDINEIDPNVFEEYLKVLNKVLPEEIKRITPQNVKTTIINYVSAGVKVPIEWIELYNKQAKDISEVIK